MTLWLSKAAIEGQSPGAHQSGAAAFQLAAGLGHLLEEKGPGGDRWDTLRPRCREAASRGPPEAVGGVPPSVEATSPLPHGR